jgi:hypothetical protein
MPPEMFRKLQAVLGFTNDQMADWSGLSCSAIEKYRSGQRRISPLLVRLLKEHLKGVGHCNITWSCDEQPYRNH